MTRKEEMLEETIDGIRAAVAADPDLRAAEEGETRIRKKIAELEREKDTATTRVISPIYAEAIRQIRKSNPHRTLFVGPGKWNSLDEVPDLRLPDDSNLVVTVHCYDPFYFTHQGASWTMPDTATTGLVYPGPPPSPMR